MLKQNVYSPLVGMLILLCLGCTSGGGSDSSSSGSGSTVTSIYLPYLTAANTSSGTSPNLFFTTGAYSFGQPHSEADCTNSSSGGCYISSFVFNGTQRLFNAARIIDAKSCNLNVLISNKLVSIGTLVSQLYKIESGSTYLKLKLNSTFDGSTVQAIKSYICTGTNANNYSQIQFTNYQLTNGTSNLEVVGANGTELYRLTGQGVFADNVWSSKTIGFKRLDGDTTSVHAQITQYSDMIDINLAYKNPYSTLSTSVVQLFGRFTLSGSTSASYAMGEGTVKANVSGMGENILSWASTASSFEDAITSIHSSNIGTQSYLAETISSDVAIGTSESWNCDAATDETFTDLSADLTVLQNFQSCASYF